VTYHHVWGKGKETYAGTARDPYIPYFAYTPPGVWTVDGLHKMEFIYCYLLPASSLFHLAPKELHPQAQQHVTLCGKLAGGKLYTIFSAHAALTRTPCEDCLDEYRKAKAIFGRLWCDPHVIPLGCGDTVAVVSPKSQDHGRQGTILPWQDPPASFTGQEVFVDTGRGAPQRFSLSELKHVVEK
jgi:hypothetical protein